MTNVVAMKCRAAITRLTRSLCAGALVACISQRSIAVFTRRVCAAWRISVGLLPPVRQQLLDPAVQLRGQSREHVFQVGPRLVPIELGRLQQAHHYRGALVGQLAADEQPVFPVMIIYALTK